MAWLPNTGALPEACLIRDEDGNVTGYHAVHVRLFGGFDTRKAGHAPWPAAGGRPPTRWEISARPHPYEIEEFEVV